MFLITFCLFILLERCPLFRGWVEVMGSTKRMVVLAKVEVYHYEELLLNVNFYFDLYSEK